MKPMKCLDTAILQQLRDTANSAPRGRAHHRIHAELDDPVQRMCITINPGSYVQPHRHANPDRWELFLILEGAATILLFDDDATVIERVDLDASGATRACEIPAAAWHTLVAQTPEAILVEVKPGPYIPLPTGDAAGWAPGEGEAATVELERWYRTARVGDCVKP